jgi:ATP-dependent RNA helicase DeaD
VESLLQLRDLNISSRLLEALRQNGIVSPTPVQEKAIPALNSGRDIMAQAQTGTGKTLAFMIPILDKIDHSKDHIQAIIVTPTRELAIQITQETNKYKSNETNVLAVYGGQDVERQIKKLSGAIHIVVGTPGRILDHLRRETISLQKVSMLVLDEADQMLHIGFLNEVKDILSHIPGTRQTMLFSATLSDQVKQLAKKYTNNPEIVKINEDRQTIKEINQIVYETTDREKQSTLCQLLDQQRPYLAVIFCRTKRRASKLNQDLLSLGYNCDELHGDLSQAKRERVMARFRNAELQFLIATDVAARGLDVEGVTHVFNYDIPEDVESYIHRIGRTGRAGGKGVAITLVALKDKHLLDVIEKGINMSLPRDRFESSALNRQERATESSNYSSKKKQGETNRKEIVSNKSRDGARPRSKSRSNGEKAAPSRSENNVKRTSDNRKRTSDSTKERSGAFAQKKSPRYSKR